MKRGCSLVCVVFVALLLVEPHVAQLATARSHGDNNRKQMTKQLPLLLGEQSRTNSLVGASSFVAVGRSVADVSAAECSGRCAPDTVSKHGVMYIVQLLMIFSMLVLPAVALRKTFKKKKTTTTVDEVTLKTLQQHHKIVQSQLRKAWFIIDVVLAFIVSSLIGTGVIPGAVVEAVVAVSGSFLKAWAVQVITKTKEFTLVYLAIATETVVAMSLALPLIEIMTLLVNPSPPTLFTIPILISFSLTHSILGSQLISQWVVEDRTFQESRKLRLGKLISTLIYVVIVYHVVGRSFRQSLTRSYCVDAWAKKAGDDYCRIFESTEMTHVISVCSHFCQEPDYSDEPICIDMAHGEDECRPKGPTAWVSPQVVVPIGTVLLLWLIFGHKLTTKVPSFATMFKIAPPDGSKEDNGTNDKTTTTINTVSSSESNTDNSNDQVGVDDDKHVDPSPPKLTPSHQTPATLLKTQNGQPVAKEANLVDSVEEARQLLNFGRKSEPTTTLHRPGLKHNKE